MNERYEVLPLRRLIIDRVVFTCFVTYCRLFVEFLTLELSKIRNWQG